MRSALQIIVDLSRASSIGDMRPNRLAVMAGVLQGFIRKFFDENPLSHLGLVIMRNGVAERLTELAGSPVSSLPKNASVLAQSLCCWSLACVAELHAETLSWAMADNRFGIIHAGGAHSQAARRNGCRRGCQPAECHEHRR